MHVLFFPNMHRFIIKVRIQRVRTQHSTIINIKLIFQIQLIFYNLFNVFVFSFHIAFRVDYSIVVHVSYIVVICFKNMCFLFYIGENTYRYSQKAYLIKRSNKLIYFASHDIILLKILCTPCLSYLGVLNELVYNNKINLI